MESDFQIDFGQLFKSADRYEVAEDDSEIKLDWVRPEITTTGERRSKSQSITTS